MGIRILLVGLFVLLLLINKAKANKYKTYILHMLFIVYYESLKRELKTKTHVSGFFLFSILLLFFS